MSDLGIFSLLVVGRDPPPTSIPTSGADYRPVDRTVPIARQREAFKANHDAAMSDARPKIVS